MADVPVSWYIDALQCRRHLRRYVGSDKLKCAGPYGIHDALYAIDIVPRGRVPDERDWTYADVGRASDFRGDARWPSKCDSCDYVFTDADEWQLFTRQLWRRADDLNAPLLTLQEVPIGAMWDADWGGGHWCGPDGRSLTVKLPGGYDWCVDGRASNCNKPDEHTHRCWVRHGDVTQNQLHVDKNGNTCGAGAGSIDLTGRGIPYHNFLHNNHLLGVPD